MGDLIRRNKALFLFGAIFFLFIFISSIYPFFFPAWTGLPERPKDDSVIPAKTLWDWLDLFLIPFFLAGGVFLLNRAETERNRIREAQEKERNREREAREKGIEEMRSLNRQYQNALDTYIVQMTRLLLSPHPYNQPGLQVARTLTLTTLQNIDEDRKGMVLQFLYEAGFLVQDEHSILSGVDFGGLELQGVNLLGANLSGIKLTKSDMQGADISLANLQGSKLEGVILDYADLIETNLQGAHLTKAKLRSANLMGAYLQGSFCVGAIFERSNLNNANFTGADLSEANIKEATTDGTIFTDTVRDNISV